MVTGGVGFIGSHLVERLLSDGHTVIVVDNFTTGKIDNLSRVKDNPHLSIHQVDVSNFNEVGALFDGVEWVFHLAALADIVPSIQDPLAYHRANVDGTAVVLELAVVLEAAGPMWGALYMQPPPHATAFLISFPRPRRP